MKYEYKYGWVGENWYDTEYGLWVSRYEGLRVEKRYYPYNECIRGSFICYYKNFTHEDLDYIWICKTPKEVLTEEFDPHGLVCS